MFKYLKSLLIATTFEYIDLTYNKDFGKVSG